MIDGTKEALPRLLVSPREAARLLSISERSLATYTARGDFPVVRIGRSVRYEVEVLHQWIREHSEKKSSQSPN